MIGRRDKSLRLLGAWLAGFALSVQLAFASWGMPGLAAPADPGEVFGGHALCLAGEPGKAAPAQPAPTAPAHDHTAFCCLWHALPGIQPLAAAAPLPVAYAEIGRGDERGTPPPAGLRRAPANARAPPTLT
jgi:hypothetical protein